MRTGKQEGNLPREHKAPALMKVVAILFVFIWLTANEWFSGFAGNLGLQHFPVMAKSLKWYLTV